MIGRTGVLSTAKLKLHPHCSLLPTARSAAHASFTTYAAATFPLPDTKGNKQIHYPVLVGDLDGLDREYWTSKRKICGSPTLNYMSQQLSYLQLHQSSTVIFCGWQQVQGLRWLEESFWTEALPIFQVPSIGEWGKDLSQHLHSRIRFCL